MPSTMGSTAFTASNATTNSSAVPHRKNAAQRTRSSSPYQERTSQKDNPTQQIIKQAVDFLIEQLEAGKSETLTAYLGAMSRFHNYSFGNILAIARQKPTATHVAGIRSWNELGRFVKKGERGIQILAPMVGYRRKDAAEQESDTKRQPVLIGFRAVYVFERLSRDLRPRCYALGGMPDAPQATRHGSAHDLQTTGVYEQKSKPKAISKGTLKTPRRSRQTDPATQTRQIGLCRQSNRP